MKAPAGPSAEDTAARSTHAAVDGGSLDRAYRDEVDRDPADLDVLGDGLVQRDRDRSRGGMRDGAGHEHTSDVRLKRRHNKAVRAQLHALDQDGLFGSRHRPTDCGDAAV